MSFLSQLRSSDFACCPHPRCGQVEDEDVDMDDPLSGLSAESFASLMGGMRNSARMTRESLDRRLKKRMKAWRRFQTVMQVRSLSDLHTSFFMKM